jgi:glucokinase
MKQYAIGIDLGGTVIKLGLVQNHKIIEERMVDAHSQKGLKPNLEIIEAQINSLLQQYEIEASHLKGIGLAFPGLVDSRAKKILSTNKKYDDACHLDLGNWVQQKWRTSFFIDNDARMTAVGEWKFGAGKGCNNLVAVTIGTGIGSSAIIEGKLLRGKHFQAGVLGGHISLNYKGNKCTCGNIGCAEAEASTWNISEKIKKDQMFSKSKLALEQNLDFEALFRVAKEKDTLALRIKDECLHIWSTAVINLIHAYDPEVVVLGGGILNSKEMILPSIQKAVDTYAWCPWGSVSILASTLNHKAAILGLTYCLEHQQ